MIDSLLTKEDLNVQLAETAEQILACYGVMCQLRSNLKNEEEFLQQVGRQMGEGYRLVYLEDEGEVRALAGYRFMELSSWGKVLYIDDLITDARVRKKGYGTKLLVWMLDQAKIAKCDQVHLDSGPHRYEAHRLYLNHGFKIIALHFALELT